MNQAILINIYDRTGEQHQLSRATVASAMAQDIPTDIYIIDNGSTHEPTKQWLKTLICHVFSYEENESPIKLSNKHMKMLFDAEYPCILCLPNDVILPPNMYRKMLERMEGIVAAGMHGANPPAIMEDVNRIHGDVHMSVVLVHRYAYRALIEKYGYFFDEGFFMYASDCDLKMRLARAEVPTAQLDILCWHYGGASHRLALGAKEAYAQADKDRDYFAKKWGFAIGSPEYDSTIATLSPSMEAP